VPRAGIGILRGEGRPARRRGAGLRHPRARGLRRRAADTGLRQLVGCTSTAGGSGDAGVRPRPAKFGVRPLEFDGRGSLFTPTTSAAGATWVCASKRCRRRRRHPRNLQPLLSAADGARPRASATQFRQEASLIEADRSSDTRGDIAGGVTPACSRSR
jgi:hypothetical protein